ncbi:MAG: multi-sensor signal transduction histidine kinase [Sporomusa sp.]|nr:multi-sensor signal transduction histidine kinase [Sporomusa sp.]
MEIFSIPKLTQKIKIRQLSSYSWLIILLGVFLNIVLWLFFWQQINYEYSKKFEETSQETMNLCIAFEEHVRRIISAADMDLLNLKQVYERDGISNPVIAGYLESEGIDAARNQIAIYNEKGFLVKSFIKNLPLANYSDRAYFQVHRDSVADTLFIGLPIQLKASGQNTIPLSRRINKPDGAFGGIAYIGLKTNYFSSFYEKMNLGPNKLIALIGMDWGVRAHQSGDNLNVGQNIYGSLLWENVQTGRTDGTYITNDDLDGVHRIVSYRVMPDYPFVLAVGKSTQVAFANTEKRKQSYILLASLTSLFSLVFCYLLISRAEQELVLNKELIRLSSLNIVGEMAAGIGHEVRNPMTTVRGYLQMFQRKPDFIKYQEHLQTMIEELDRANSIITEFLSLAKNKTVELTQGSLNNTINTLMPLLQADALHKGHDIEFIATDLPNIQFDEKEIRQLILNITRNGLEAMESSGKITIKTYLDGGREILAIQDTGSGIPEEVKIKLGTPFVTTKESGTGLGLPVCYRIAQRHGADIDLETSDQGTTFFIKFPCYNGNLEKR